MQQHGEDVIVNCMGENSKDFHGIIDDFEVLGYDEKPEFTRDDDKMTINAPFVDSDKPVVYKMTLR
jgi:alpha-L-fucosidase